MTIGCRLVIPICAGRRLIDAIYWPQPWKLCCILLLVILFMVIPSFRSDILEFLMKFTLPDSLPSLCTNEFKKNSRISFSVVLAGLFLFTRSILLLCKEWFSLCIDSFPWLLSGLWSFGLSLLKGYLCNFKVGLYEALVNREENNHRRCWLSLLLIGETAQSACI